MDVLTDTGIVQGVELPYDLLVEADTPVPGFERMGAVYTPVETDDSLVVIDEDAIVAELAGQGREVVEKKGVAAVRQTPLWKRVASALVEAVQEFTPRKAVLASGLGAVAGAGILGGSSVALADQFGAAYPNLADYRVPLGIMGGGHRVVVDNDVTYTYLGQLRIGDNFVLGIPLAFNMDTFTVARAHVMYALSFVNKKGSELSVAPFVSPLVDIYGGVIPEAGLVVDYQGITYHHRMGLAYNHRVSGKLHDWVPQEAEYGSMAVTLESIRRTVNLGLGAIHIGVGVDYGGGFFGVTQYREAQEDFESSSSVARLVLMFKGDERPYPQDSFPLSCRVDGGVRVSREFQASPSESVSVYELNPRVMAQCNIPFK